MPLHRLEELRYPELDSFDRQKTLFLLVVSPLEEHGPHLPLGVDAFNAEYFAQEMSQRFLQGYPRWNVVRIPTLYVGSFLFDAAGSISVRPRTIRNLLTETLSCLAKYGFRYFLVSNAHGGPTHVVALEEATRKVSRRYGVRAVSFSGHLIWNFLRGKYWPELRERLGLSDEEMKALKDDAHAGQWETSMMLKLRPDLVDPSYKSLKPFAVKLIERLQPNYPLKKGEKLGYVGHPSRADVELAEISSRFLMDKAFELIQRDLLSDQPLTRSMFYKMPLFHTNFLAVLVILITGVGILLWMLTR